MVILLITGPLCSGKETLANILKTDYNYKLHKLESSSFLNLWDKETKSINFNAKEQILKESILNPTKFIGKKDNNKVVV